MSMKRREIPRRGLFRAFGLLTATAAILPFLGRVSGAVGVAPEKQDVRVRDLARRREAILPRGGTYDHESQQMRDYEIKLADTGTDTDEDQEQSTTFWDGESQ